MMDKALELREKGKILIRIGLVVAADRLETFEMVGCAKVVDPILGGLLPRERRR